VRRWELLLKLMEHLPLRSVTLIDFSRRMPDRAIERIARRIAL
jgi:hypothetical protein